MLSSPLPDSLLTLMEIRALSVDHLSTARYVVATAFARGANDHYSTADMEAFAEFVRSPHYADVLLGNRTYGAWVGSDMVGIAAWSAGEAPSPTARVVAVFVHPLFSGNGIGTRLTEYLEVEAANAGYRALEISATLNAVELLRAIRAISRRARRGLGSPGGPRDADRLHAQAARRPSRYHALTS